MRKEFGQVTVAVRKSIGGCGVVIQICLKLKVMGIFAGESKEVWSKRAWIAVNLRPK
jgi:hypothetical protein